MSIITITTDWGSSDPDLASLKGLLLRNCGSHIQIVDINSRILPFDFQQAAYMLRNSYTDFPDKTIHLVLVDLPGGSDTRLLLGEKQNQFFMMPDNGFVSVCFDSNPEKVFELASREDFRMPGYSNRKTVAEACGKLLNDEEGYLNTLKPVAEYKELNPPLAVKKENGLWGKVMHVDEFENVITNISKPDYIQVGKGRDFSIRYRTRETMDHITNKLCDGGYGDRLCYFDSRGYLKIAIKQGNAASLLGLKRDDDIIIEFK